MIATVQAVRAELDAHGAGLDGRTRVEGPAIELPGDQVQTLAMALHELATNALKYGALSNATGRVHLDWRVVASGGAEVFQFSWTEAGGPPVAPPSRMGFGSRLIERATAAEFGGEVSLDYAPEGVRWRLSAPYAGLAERGRGDVADLAG